MSTRSYILKMLPYKLSKGFPFVSVDFFNVKGNVYLSELTFDSGDGHRKFTPASFDEELGRLFHIDVKSSPK